MKLKFLNHVSVFAFTAVMTLSAHNASASNPLTAGLGDLNNNNPISSSTSSSLNPLSALKDIPTYLSSIGMSQVTPQLSDIVTKFRSGAFPGVGNLTSPNPQQLLAAQYFDNNGVPTPSNSSLSAAQYVMYAPSIPGGNISAPTLAQVQAAEQLINNLNNATPSLNQINNLAFANQYLTKLPALPGVTTTSTPSLTSDQVNSLSSVDEINDLNRNPDLSKSVKTQILNFMQNQSNQPLGGVAQVISNPNNPVAQIKILWANIDPTTKKPIQLPVGQDIFAMLPATLQGFTNITNTSGSFIAFSNLQNDASAGGLAQFRKTFINPLQATAAQAAQTTQPAQATQAAATTAQAVQK